MNDPSVRQRAVLEVRATEAELAGLLAELRGRGLAAERAPAEAPSLQAVRMEVAAQTARVLAHEIANYLGGIRTMLYVIEDEVPAGSDAKADLHTVAQTVEAGTQFLSAIRGFVHAEPLGPEPADLNAIVRDAEQELRGALPARVSLTLRIADGPLWVRGEAPRLARLAADLLAAATSGMAPGTEVVLETRRDGAAPAAGGPTAMLAVRARGRVLEPAALERIFEPFIADRGHEGGLRLPTVYAVVTESGGTVAAESSAAEGTTIRIGLPLAEPPAGGKGTTA
jgi:two-component system cell cycle sensor histidine kinase/response regulator CckA